VRHGCRTVLMGGTADGCRFAQGRSLRRIGVYQNRKRLNGVARARAGSWPLFQIRSSPGTTLGACGGQCRATFVPSGVAGSGANLQIICMPLSAHRRVTFGPPRSSTRHESEYQFGLALAGRSRSHASVRLNRARRRACSRARSDESCGFGPRKETRVTRAVRAGRAISTRRTACASTAHAISWTPRSRPARGDSSSARLPSFQHAGRLPQRRTMPLPPPSDRWKARCSRLARSPPSTVRS
jgi:hypothetical protein